MKKTAFILFPLLILFLYSPSLFAAIHNWGTTGVADTSKVSQILQLTNNNVDNELNGGSSFMISPWSTDGKWIVYRDTSVTGGNICVVNSATGTSTCLTNDFLNASEYISNPGFGTDNKVYFEKRTAASVYQIWRMNSDGTQKENLTSVHGGVTDERYVKVSPDGQWIAYFNNNLLWVAQSNGSGAHVVSVSIQVDYPHYSWSPDSQWLAYQGSEGGQKWIYKARVDGTENIPLTKLSMIIDPQTHSWPSWSPDGDKIAYLWSGDGLLEHKDAIKIITTDGLLLQTLDSVIRPLADYTLGLYGPFSWSPDSQWITYIKQGGGDKAIFIVNVEDPGQKTQLTTGYTDNTPIWSPAGGHILFADAGSG